MLELSLREIADNFLVYPLDGLDTLRKHMCQVPCRKIAVGFGIGCCTFEN